MIQLVGCVLLCIANAKGALNDKLWRGASDVSSDLSFLSSTLLSMSANSNIQCGMRASTISWALSFCFKYGICQVSDLGLLPLNKTQLLETPNAVCFTSIEPGSK